MDIPFPQTIERYVRRWRPTLRPATIVNKRSLLMRFTAYLHEHHPDVQSFSQILRYPHIEGWLEHILYMKSASRNATIRTLKLFFEDLIHWQWPEPLRVPPRRLRPDHGAPGQPTPRTVALHLAARPRQPVASAHARTRPHVPPPAYRVHRVLTFHFTFPFLDVERLG